MHAGREPRPPRIPRGRADVVGPEPEQELRAGRKVGEGSRPGPPRDVRERGGDGGTVTPLRRGEVHLRRAHHLSDVGVHRVLVELVRGARLDDAPVAEHPDALAHAERLQLVGRRVEHRRAELPVQPLELRAHVVAELGVEVGQRLVEEQQARAADEGPADRDPLLLAAARGFGLPVEDVPDAEHFRHLAHAGPDLGPCDAGLAEGIGEVLEDGEVGIEGEGLEHHRDPPIGRRDARDVLAVEFHPPAVRRLEPGDDPQGRGLAGRARPEQAEELPVPDVEVDAVEGHDRAEALSHPFQAKVNVRLRVRAGFGGGGRAQGPGPIVPRTGRSIVQRLRRPVKLGATSRPASTVFVFPVILVFVPGPFYRPSPAPLRSISVLPRPWRPRGVRRPYWWRKLSICSGSHRARAGRRMTSTRAMISSTMNGITPLYMCTRRISGGLIPRR